MNVPESGQSTPNFHPSTYLVTGQRSTSPTHLICLYAGYDLKTLIHDDPQSILRMFAIKLPSGNLTQVQKISMLKLPSGKLT